MTSRRLRAVPDAPKQAPPPSYDYEWQQRQRIRQQGFGRVHIEADRRPFISLPIARPWRWR